MAVVTLDIKESPNQTFSVILEDTLYDIALQFNQRDESWYITLGLSGLDPLFKTKVTNGVDILKKYRSYDACPKGGLYVLDRVKGYGRLTLDSFTTGRFGLIYLTEDSREAVGL